MRQMRLLSRRARKKEGKKAGPFGDTRLEQTCTCLRSPGFVGFVGFELLLAAAGEGEKRGTLVAFLLLFAASGGRCCTNRKSGLCWPKLLLRCCTAATFPHTVLADLIRARQHSAGGPIAEPLVQQTRRPAFLFIRCRDLARPSQLRFIASRSTAVLSSSLDGVISGIPAAYNLGDPVSWLRSCKTTRSPPWPTWPATPTRRRP